MLHLLTPQKADRFALLSLHTVSATVLEHLSGYDSAPNVIVSYYDLEVEDGPNAYIALEDLIIVDLRDLVISSTNFTST